MKLTEAIKMKKAAHDRRRGIRLRKAHDYAKRDADCLSNFKVMADIEAALKKHGYSVPIEKPHGVAFWHALHKMVRILNLWSEGIEPENESLRDTHDDLANYNDLAYECFLDYRDSSPKEVNQSESLTK